MHTFAVAEKDTSRAWVAACSALDVRANPRRDGFHTVVRIEDATADDPVFRAELERVRQAEGYEPIETVANTIFPDRLAATCHSPEQLAARYRAMYPQLRRLAAGNRHGTYFGRIVSYTGPEGPVDQLTALIARLRQQAAGRGPMTAAYEVDIAHPQDQEPDPMAETWAVPVHAAGKDNVVRGFPCLSHCSFQLDRESAVHLVALYRSHYMLDRAYGNYLGLGRLAAYVADHAGLHPGSLTVVAGHAQIDGPISRIRPLLKGTPSLLAT
jgi:thymidylate synthase